MKPFTAGGHNLHDAAGTPVANGSVMFWTEAIPSIIKQHVSRLRYRLLYVERDTSMVLGLERLRFKVESAVWHRAHGGVGQVTPARGSLVVRYHARALRKRNRTPMGSILSHRINGSEPGHRPPPPYVPGEDQLRERLYDEHYQLDARLDLELEAEGRERLHGGDYNRHGGLVYPASHDLAERGKNPDRAAASKGLRLGPIHWLPKRGSDHPSWVVEVTPVS